MTKVIAPLQSGQASGKYQNLVFARNQYGQYSRDFVAATNPNSTDQQTFRNAFQSTANLWNNTAQISQSERDGWNNFARINPVQDRFGNQRFMSGYNWFMKLNMPRAVAGFGAHHFPPASTVADYLPTVTIFRRGNGDLVASVDPLPTGDAFLIFSYVENQNVGRSFRPNKTKFAGACTSASADPFVLIDNATLSSTEKRQFITYTAYNQVGIGTPKREYNQVTGPTVNQLELTIDNSNPTEGEPNTVKNTACNMSTFTANTTTCFIFKFNSSLIPNFASVTEAKLLWSTGTVAGGPLDISLYNILQEWDHDEATWNDRLSSISWGIPGLESGVDYDATPIDTINISTSGDYEFSLTNFFNELATGVTQTQGILLLCDNGTGVAVRSVYCSPTVQRPEISITYYENP